MKKLANFLWKKKIYVIVFIIFAFAILYGSDTNIFVIHHLQREVADINRESDMLEKQIIEEQSENEKLRVHPEALEAYGRETYYMKRANEDIFIIKTQEK
ncbi:MAG: septum formation initiator family protein [Bacteroidales bacterium]|nr:septum formation initiator family protein [Bacteroidales bacterium]